MGEPTVRTRKWTRLEYDRLAEAEILGPEDRIELLGGEMIVKEPQYSPHATGVRLVQRALEGAFGTGWDVRPQMPVALDEESEPEPDICVVPGHPRDYRDAHPERPVLIVEVSLSRLGFDRERKGSLYARAGIADYWIVNIPGRRVEVYREPVPDGAAPFGWRYGRAVTLGPAERVSPLAAPAAAVAVADLLPVAQTVLEDAMTHPSAVSLCGAATVFVVQDVLRSVEHYRDVLGFHTEFTYGQPTFYAGVERDGVVIHLQAASETKRQPGHGAVNVFATDVDALYQELKSRGARTLNEPKDYPYGMRDFDIHDLDGNQLCFGMESKQPPPAQ